MGNGSSSIGTMSNMGSSNSRSSCVSTVSNSNWGGSYSRDRGSNSLGDSLDGVSASLVDNWL